MTEIRDLPDGDRRGGRDRREGFVDSVLYGRVADAFDRAEEKYLHDDLDDRARVLANGLAEGLATALSILSGEPAHAIRAKAIHRIAAKRRSFDGMTSIGQRTETALEVLAPAEESDACPTCGAPMAGPGHPSCPLLDEHGFEVLDLPAAEILREHGIGGA